MNLEKQVEDNTKAIGDLKDAHAILMRDHGRLMGLYEAQKQAVETLRSDIKDDIRELKTDNRAAINELKDALSEEQRQRDEKHQKEQEAAERKWPRRAHLTAEFLLALIAGIELIGRMTGKW